MSTNTHKNNYIRNNYNCNFEKINSKLIWRKKNLNTKKRISEPAKFENLKWNFIFLINYTWH
jgi:hypothetical protein